MKVIVLDTETTNSIDDPICYDIGWAVVDPETGEIFETRSFAVAEIFLDKELMSYAYFADKIPSYWDEIKRGERKLARLYNIRKALQADCKKYFISEIYAHNARFDYRSCNLTQRFLTSSKYRYFFPYGITICDTLKMAKEAFKNCPEYCDFCERNNYKTEKGQNRYTAEILYRFFTGDNDFMEEHKGLDDVRIEKEILKECLRRGITKSALWS